MTNREQIELEKFIKIQSRNVLRVDPTIRSVRSIIQNLIGACYSYYVEKNSYKSKIELEAYHRAGSANVGYYAYELASTKYFVKTAQILGFKTELINNSPRNSRVGKIWQIFISNPNNEFVKKLLDLQYFKGENN